jgi:hypothetical protein
LAAVGLRRRRSTTGGRRSISDHPLTGGQFPTEGHSMQQNITPFLWFNDQAEEAMNLWEKLSAGGQTNQCGWLKDKYGVSWQIVPRVLSQLLGDKDPARSKRVMQAMMQMTKIDIAQLKEAYGQS